MTAAATEVPVAPELGEAPLGPDERAALARIVAANMRTLHTVRGVTPRGQHGKAHGVVRARFVVRDDIPERLRVGLFAAPAAFDALVRFSNGSHDDDRRPDAHGMAIKVLGAPGASLAPDPGGEASHDFILIDQKTFFCRDLLEYCAFGDAYSDIVRFLHRQGSVFAFARGIAALKLMRPSLGKRAKAFAAQTPRSPLTAHYWSATPYRLGDAAVKYMAVSPLAGGPGAQAGVTDPDGLRLALSWALRHGPAIFEFGVHLRSDPARHPVEDPTVDWARNGAEFVKLAHVEIPAQTVAPINAASERLVFSLWNCPEVHRPLGAINRARREVYLAMARERLARDASAALARQA